MIDSKILVWSGSDCPYFTVLSYLLSESTVRGSVCVYC